MARRRAVAASVVSAILFSSLVVSNYVLFAGDAQNFRYVSLSSEEEEIASDSLVLRGVTVLSLLDRAQVLLASTPFLCSGAADSISHELVGEKVRLVRGGLTAESVLGASPGGNLGDNLTSLRPFNGSVAGWTDLEAVTVVEGGSPDRSVVYNRSETHALNLPIRIDTLTADCLGAASRLSSALTSLGGSLCNSTLLAETVSSVADPASASAASDGLSVTVSYDVVSTSPCGVEYSVTAIQPVVAGPLGAFTFTEGESGFVQA